MITEFKLKSGFFVYFQSQVDGKTKPLLNLLDLESSLFSDDEDELRVLDRDEDEIEVATHSKVIQPYATFNSTYNHRLLPPFQFLKSLSEIES